MSELDGNDLKTVADAIRIIDSVPVDRVNFVGQTRVPTGRLERDVHCDRDYPPFDKSLMDGFAVRSADVASAPCELNLIGEVAAGGSGAISIPRGSCVAIMTGATVPADADAVVPVEQTTSSGSRIRINRSPKKGAAIARKGSDLPAGAIVLKQGAPVGPAQVGALVQVGAIGLIPASIFACDSALSAHVLVTGNEIVDENAIPDTEQMRDVNGPLLAAMLSSLGVSCDRSRVIDEPVLIRDSIDRLARERSLLFITGGMSMGAYDYVPRALMDLGFELKITKLRIKPGKPFVFATRTRAGKTDFVFGLPGNPVAGFCCTLRLASRLIARMQGRPIIEPTSATLAAPLPTNGPREFYQPAIVNDDAVTPLDWKGSADVFTLACANALLIRPIDEPARNVGEPVSIMRFS